MMHKALSQLDRVLGINQAQAHCDIPCSIYDPISAQLAALSVIRFLDLINELEERGDLTVAQQATLSRLVGEKETHAEKAKHEVRIIWGDFLKQPQFEKFPQTHELVHQIMLAGSACKQHIDRDNGLRLLALINDFAAIFWEAKGVETFTAECPYPPSQQVVYPKLG